MLRSAAEEPVEPAPGVRVEPTSGAARRPDTARLQVVFHHPPDVVRARMPPRASDGSPHPAANDVHGTRPGLGTDPRSRDPPKARLQRIGAVHRGVCVTTTLSESGVGRAASATAAAVSSNGNVWVTSDRTSKRREKTSRATSRWSVKSDE